MKVKLFLSKKKDLQGHSEILLLIRKKYKGKVIDLRSNSGIFIDPKMFDEKKGVVKSFSANKKIITKDVAYHNTQFNKLNELIFRITEAYNSEQDKQKVCGSWLKDVVFSYSISNNKKNIDNITEKNGIYELYLIFLERKKFSSEYYRGMMVCIRSLARYELFIRFTDRRRRNFCLDVDTIKKSDIYNFIEYLENEKTLSEKYPKIFNLIFSNYPANIGNGNCKIENKGGNTICKYINKLKSFFTWLNREGVTTNQPFTGVELVSEKYGTPYYLTCDERDLIASTQMPSSFLETQRDIFIFQCYIGCRVGDLIKLTRDNITQNVLVYTPHKTKEEGEQSFQARVPLHSVPLQLIKKYDGVDKHGRLFPFISSKYYNEVIKEIFTIAGITRMVEVRNTITGEIENRPINELASSHLARRTFIGNLYSKVPDPNLIGKMSGHVDGSKAFERYRKIEDDTLRNVIELL